MDGTILTYPPPLFREAAIRPNIHSFHRKTREGISENVSLKNSKAIVIGDLGVGKTSVINRYCRDSFEKNYKPTIGVEFEVKVYEVLGHEFHLELWDTSGEERFKCITRSYYRGTNVVLVVFDLTDPITLADVNGWFDEANDNITTTAPDFFLVGNKKDNCKSHRLQPMRQEAMRIANELRCEYWEVSALSGENVKKLFTRVAAVCFDQTMQREYDNWSQKASQKVQVGQGLQIKNKQTISNKEQPTVDLTQQHTDVNSEKRKKCCS